MKTADGGERPFRINGRATIGRESKCHVRIAVPSVSRQHCEIKFDERDGGVLRMCDLNSELGTFHNGTRVQEAVLSHSDTLQVGPVTFEIRFDGISGNGTAAAAQRVEPNLIANAPDRNTRSHA